MERTQTPLELLRQLINASIDLVQEDIKKHHDPPLDLSEGKRHPIRDRYDPAIARALRCISSSGMMLRALCDVDNYMTEIIFSVNDMSALNTVSQADIANVISDHPLHVDELEKKTGIEADKLARYLRALSNLHIFQELEPQVLANNELSILLKSEGIKALCQLNTDEIGAATRKSWEALVHPSFKCSSAANKTAFNLAFNTDFGMYEYWKQLRPDLAERGGAAFASLPIGWEAFLGLYPWAAEKSGTLVVDVGGGVGGGTMPIIKRFSNLRLLVQDLPTNKGSFHKHIKKNYPEFQGSDRVRFMGHDFFNEQPIKEADIYFLRRVIHNWPDDQAIKILGNISRAMGGSSKLFICEHVAFPTYRPADLRHEGNFIAPPPLLANWGAVLTSRLDLQVLACVNGRQRTRDEYSTLVGKAGLVTTKFWKSPADEVTIIECHLNQSE
ncbi:hypothetical protein LOZ53_002970 [Ophidiomyces ophidiicola]|nr:hypothetical protein LOZ53_002970 [Ophidiomyces ophidiicola]